MFPSPVCICCGYKYTDGTLYWGQEHRLRQDTQRPHSRHWWVYWATQFLLVLFWETRFGRIFHQRQNGVRNQLQITYLGRYQSNLRFPKCCGNRCAQGTRQTKNRIDPKHHIVLLPCHTFGIRACIQTWYGNERVVDWIDYWCSCSCCDTMHKYMFEQLGKDTRTFT